MLELTFTRLAGSPDVPRLLVVGPSLGTSVEALWERAAPLVAEQAEVVGWDLPGHGRSAAARERFTIADLADAVAAQVPALAAGRPVTYAGVSLGGAVGLQLMLGARSLEQVVCIASAAKIAEPSAWTERAALVRQSGTPVMVGPSSERWFADGFVGREQAVASRLLLSLSDCDDESYALACEALAEFDLRSRLTELTVPLVVAVGAADIVVSPEEARETAAAVRGATFRVVSECAHLPPAEAPVAVADIIKETWE